MDYVIESNDLDIFNENCESSESTNENYISKNLKISCIIFQISLLLSLFTLGFTLNKDNTEDVIILNCFNLFVNLFNRKKYQKEIEIEQKKQETINHWVEVFNNKLKQKDYKNKFSTTCPFIFNILQLLIPLLLVSTLILYGIFVNKQVLLLLSSNLKVLMKQLLVFLIIFTALFLPCKYVVNLCPLGVSYLSLVLTIIISLIFYRCPETNITIDKSHYNYLYFLFITLIVIMNSTKILPIVYDYNKYMRDVRYNDRCRTVSKYFKTPQIKLRQLLSRFLTITDIEDETHLINTKFVIINNILKNDHNNRLKNSVINDTNKNGVFYDKDQTKNNITEIVIAIKQNSLNNSDDKSNNLNNQSKVLNKFLNDVNTLSEDEIELVKKINLNTLFKATLSDPKRVYNYCFIYDDGDRIPQSDRLIKIKTNVIFFTLIEDPDLLNKYFYYSNF